MPRKFTLIFLSNVRDSFKIIYCVLNRPIECLYIESVRIGKYRMPAIFCSKGEIRSYCVGLLRPPKLLICVSWGSANSIIPFCANYINLVK